MRKRKLNSEEILEENSLLLAEVKAEYKQKKRKNRK